MLPNIHSENTGCLKCGKNSMHNSVTEVKLMVNNVSCKITA